MQTATRHNNMATLATIRSEGTGKDKRYIVLDPREGKGIAGTFPAAEVDKAIALKDELDKAIADEAAAFERARASQPVRFYIGSQPDDADKAKGIDGGKFCAVLADAALGNRYPVLTAYRDQMEVLIANWDTIKAEFDRMNAQPDHGGIGTVKAYMARRK